MSAEAFGAAPFSIRDAVRRLDVRVFVPALLLSAMGLFAIGATRPDLVAAQFQGFAVGVVIAVLLTLVPYRAVLASAWPFWICTAILLVVVLIPGVGHGAKGAHRWLRIGDVQFQPSEIAKCAQVLLLARYIRFRQDHRSLKGLVVPFVLTLLPMLLIVKEPDLGTSLLLVPVLFAMLWVAGAQTRHLVTVIVLGLASIPLIYANLHGYQKQRVNTYLVQMGVPLPAGEQLSDAARRDADYHVTQSVIAVANGGVTGQGWGEGAMNLSNRVPEDWTDFVFVVHAEEWGLVGVALLLLVWGGLLAGIAMLAQECRDPAARLICVGAFTLLGVQACVNLMMTVGLAPVTGVPLPFSSYGRSAMLSAWVLIGLVLHARSREPYGFTSTDFDR